jgi:hypothetical protein
MAKKKSAPRRAAIGILAAGIAVLLWILLTRQSPIEASRQRLNERTAQYAALREANDWPKLYELVDPSERKKTSIAHFMSVYGTGVLPVTKAVVKEVVFDPNKTVAKTTIQIDAELDISKLPPEARNMQLGDPAQRRTSGPCELQWVWRGGEWYFRLDEQATRPDSHGRTPKPLTPPPETKPAPDPGAAPEKK